MEEKKPAINTKVQKLKILTNYENMILQIEKVLKAAIIPEFSLIQFRQNLKAFVDLIRTELTGNEKLYLEIISQLEYDNQYYAHLVNTTIFSCMLARELDLPEQKMQTLLSAAILHDIGKVKFPKKILDAIVSLKEEGLIGVFQNHPILGERFITRYLKLSDDIGAVVLNHHEQPDGSGFPGKLDSSKLNLLDNILIAANFYEMLCQKLKYSGLENLRKNVQMFLQKYPLRFTDEIKKATTALFELDAVRKFTRYKLNSSAILKDGVSGIDFNCIVVDFSCGGAKISTMEQLNRERNYKLNLRVVGNIMLKNKICKVTWEKQVNQNWEYGIEFLQPELPFSKDVEKMLEADMTFYDK